MKLAELPAMLVEKIEKTANGLRVHGRFDRLIGVSESGCFRFKRGEYAWANLKAINKVFGTVLVTDDRDPDIGRLRVGERYIWFDDYWQAPLIEAIADNGHEWRQFTHEPSDSVQFRQGTVIGWQKADQPLPNDAVYLGKKSGGWDHEHCGLCNSPIDADHPIGYTDDDSNFLCSICYTKYGATHDVSFQLTA